MLWIISLESLVSAEKLKSTSHPDNIVDENERAVDVTGTELIHNVIDDGITHVCKSYCIFKHVASWKETPKLFYLN